MLCVFQLRTCAKKLLALCSLTLNHARLVLLNTQRARPDVHYINTSQVPTIISTVSEYQRQFSSPKSQWGCFDLEVLYLLKCRLRTRVTQGHTPTVVLVDQKTSYSSLAFSSQNSENAVN